jgi:hypothetical protein
MTFRDDPAKYMRERRARLKAQTGAPSSRTAEAAHRAGRARSSPDAIMKASERNIGRVWAKADVIGPGGVITKTNGRLDVLPRAVFEPREKGLPPSPPPPSQSRALAVVSPSRPPMPPAYTPPPQSMMAVGGRAPDRSGFSSVATQSAQVRANLTAIVNQLAEVALAERRSREALERRVEALEVQARQATVEKSKLVQAGLSLFALIGGVKVG